ncbi:MAG: hypothetical protein KME19_08930 [Microcoleus vaginatus WJT46-NPBG5]|jgi:hypothetical protein|nr:hypothetical protein [Microcoleus vaginatus WJT46-NPBG5]MBW4680224.1 hypothetical protein [Microcoleus vaginatus WJT46-NPBG5]
MALGLSSDDFAFAASAPEGADWQEGLSKREYFAIKIMGAIISNRGISTANIEGMEGHARNVATHALIYADALMEALSKPTVKTQEPPTESYEELVESKNF